jgi:hypothetical protein
MVNQLGFRGLGLELYGTYTSPLYSGCCVVIQCV